MRHVLLCIRDVVTVGYVIANQRARWCGPFQGFPPVTIRTLSLPPWGRWHGAAVTDEGLASPHGRGAPGRGGEGDFYLLSHFVTAHPEREPRGMRIATPVCALARNDSNCRNALQERYRAVPNRITNTDQPCTHCQRRLAAEFFQIPIDKVGYGCYTANTYQTGE